MPRYFNITGPCRPEEHYILPPEARIPAVQGFIDRGLYFTVHAPRQSGKTTCFRTLADNLTASGWYTALLTTCETGQKQVPDLEKSIAAVIQMLQERAETYLSSALRPPKPDPAIIAENRLLTS